MSDPNSNPPAYSYTLAILAILLGAILIPIVWGVLKGIVKIIVILACALAILYGISLLVNRNH